MMELGEGSGEISAHLQVLWQRSEKTSHLPDLYPDI